ncbi:MAG: LysM peptidoglycan-binding domain-containing protein [Rubricoccaceae bacterium]
MRLFRLSALLVVLVASFGLAAQAQSNGDGLYTVRAGDTLFRIARTFAVDIGELRQLNGLDGDYISVGQTLRLSASAQVPTSPRPQTPTAEQPTVERPTDPPPAARQDVTHVVEAGETLFRIALRYDTSVEDLRRLNSIQGDQIEIGQRLIVSRDGPARPVTPEAPISPGIDPPVTTPVTPPEAQRPKTVQPVALSEARPWSINNTTIPADLVHFTEPGETLYGIAARYGLPLVSLISGNALTTAPLEPGTALHLPTRVRPSDAAERTLPDVVASGLALVYPDVMSGRRTSSGEAYDPLEFTASHREYPFGTVLLITNPMTGRSTFVRVIDRGPVSEAYLIELSAAAATALDLDPNAARQVEIRELP